MQNFIIESADGYTEEKASVLLKGLSIERLSRYSTLAPDNRIKQLQLYTWNTALSESLYTPIQGLEVTARNYFYRELVDYLGVECFDSNKIKLAFPQHRSLIQAKESLQKEGKPLTAVNLISLLSFGFWAGLLGSKYETSLWRPCLYKAFGNKPTPFLRKHAHHEFDLIRILRNRIAHHEPILRPDLSLHYIRIIKMLRWFCEETAYWIDAQSRFNTIWNLSVNPFI